MALIGNTKIRGNMKTAGISTWAVRGQTDAGVEDGGFYSFGTLYDTKFTLDEVMIVDDNGRESQWGFLLKAEAKVLGCAKATWIKMLDTLSRYDLQHYIITSDGSHYSTNLLSDKISDFNFDLSIEGGAGKNRYTLITTQRYITLAELATMEATDADYPGTGAGGDVLATLSAGAKASAACVTVEFRPTGESSGYDVLGEFRNFKFHAKSVADDEPDELGRHKAVAIEINYEVEGLQSSITERGFGATIATNATGLDHKFTFEDGTIFSSSNVLGSRWAFASEGPTKKKALVKMSGTGFITNTPASTWDSLWPA